MVGFKFVSRLSLLQNMKYKLYCDGAVSPSLNTGKIASSF